MMVIQAPRIPALALSVYLAFSTFGRSISPSDGKWNYAEDTQASARAIGQGKWPRSTRAIAPGVPPRILPLGDSITWEYQSSDGNGYRLDLLNDLIAGGSKVTYVRPMQQKSPVDKQDWHNKILTLPFRSASQQSGTMPNNQNDGFVGYTISEIANSTKPTLSQLPNVILLHAGTNDMNLDPPRQPYDTAPERLGDLINELLEAVSETTIVVAKIIQSSNVGTKDRIPVFNDAVPDAVAKRAAKGAKVQLVDISSIGVDGMDLADGLHPNDTGYNTMANFWMQGLQEASDKGWITPPQ